MHSIIRFGEDLIRERSTGDTNPDVVIVLDNSLFGIVDMTKGLKNNGLIMAAGLDSGVLGEKAKDFQFVNIDSFLRKGLSWKRICSRPCRIKT
jgi:pyruvate ferredoxin oxidoreductase gamma subunit